MPAGKPLWASLSHYEREWGHGSRAFYRGLGGQLLGDLRAGRMVMDGRRWCAGCNDRKAEEAFTDARDRGVCGACWAVRDSRG